MKYYTYYLDLCDVQCPYLNIHTEVMFDKCKPMTLRQSRQILYHLKYRINTPEWQRTRFHIERYE